MADREILVSLRNITTQIGHNLIHKDLNLDIKQGEILGIIGGSGTGKSVLLHTILGLRKAAAGEVILFGKNTAHLSDRDLLLTRKRLGVVFQGGALFSSLTVAENIKVPLKEYTKLSDKFMNQIAAMKLSLTGLPIEAGLKLPSELSGGMSRRAGLARSLALDPSLLFLDEPTTGLDPISAGLFDRLMLNLKENLDLTICMITHDFDSLYNICDKVAVLAEKRIIAVVPPAELLNLDNQWIKSLGQEDRCRRAENMAAVRLEGNSRGGEPQGAVAP